MKRVPLPRVPERVVQRQCVALLRSLGAQVWVLGTTRRQGDYHGTMQSPGLPDAIAALKGRMVMCEFKAAGGRLRPEQAAFRQACQDCGVHHVVGGVDALVAWLVAEGLVRTDCVAHYRLPSDPTAPAPRRAASAARRREQGAPTGVEPSSRPAPLYRAARAVRMGQARPGVQQGRG